MRGWHTELRWARALPRWMRLLPGEVEKLLAGAGARFRGQGGRFNLYLEYVLEIELIDEKVTACSNIRVAACDKTV